MLYFIRRRFFRIFCRFTTLSRLFSRVCLTTVSKSFRTCFKANFMRDFIDCAMLIRRLCPDSFVCVCYTCGCIHMYIICTVSAYSFRGTKRMVHERCPSVSRTMPQLNAQPRCRKVQSGIVNILLNL